MVLVLHDCKEEDLGGYDLNDKENDWIMEQWRRDRKFDWDAAQPLAGRVNGASFAIGLRHWLRRNRQSIPTTAHGAKRRNAVPVRRQETCPGIGVGEGEWAQPLAGSPAT